MHIIPGQRSFWKQCLRHWRNKVYKFYCRTNFFFFFKAVPFYCPVALHHCTNKSIGIRNWDLARSEPDIPFAKLSARIAVSWLTWTLFYHLVIFASFPFPLVSFFRVEEGENDKDFSVPFFSLIVSLLRLSDSVIGRDWRLREALDLGWLLWQWIFFRASEKQSVTERFLRQRE